jgi:hypothetical protein
VAQASALALLAVLATVMRQLRRVLEEMEGMGR